MPRLQLPRRAQHVTFIGRILQPSSFIGGVEFGMNAVTATATPVGGATVCAYR